MPITVLIVDDHQLIHNGIDSMLSETDTQIVGNALDAEHAIRLVAELQPELMLLDILMPGISGIETLEKVKQISPGTKVIMLSLIHI